MIPEAHRARSLFLHRFVFRLALSAGNIFAWIVVYRLFFVATQSLETSLAGVASLYALTHAIAFFCTPLTGLALRHGVRRALVYGTIVCSASFAVISLVFAESFFSPEHLYPLISAFVVLQGIYRALYWIPYRTEEIAGIAHTKSALLLETVVALMPLLSGFALTQSTLSPLYVFGGIAFSIFVSALVLLRIPESHEPYRWSYADTLLALVSRHNNTAVGLFIFDGMQGAALLLIWPLAAFLVIGESFQVLGAIITATFCIALFGRSLVRKVLAWLKVGRSPAVLASIVFSSWIMRLAAGSPIQLIAVDVVYNAGNSPRRFSIDSIAHEQLADAGHFVDEYTALKEMALSIGRISMCLLFIVVVLNTSESVAFVAALLVAAMSGAASVFLAHKLERDVL